MPDIFYVASYDSFDNWHVHFRRHLPFVQIHVVVEMTFFQNFRLSRLWVQYLCQISLEFSVIGVCASKWSQRSKWLITGNSSECTADNTTERLNSFSLSEEAEYPA